MNSQEAAGPQKYQPPSSNQLDDEGIIKLSEYLAVLLEAKNMIFAMTCVGLFAGLFYAFFATPQFSANALIQVEPKQVSSLARLDEMVGLFESDSSVEAEMELVQSRMVLNEAVVRLGLHIRIEPKYFPLVGESYARRYAAKQQEYKSKSIIGVAKPWFYFSSYAWGGEDVKLEVFDVPEVYHNQPLKLVVGEGGRYTLSLDDKILIKNKIGVLAQQLHENEQAGIQARDVHQQVFQIHISELKARPGTEFTLTRISTHLVSSSLKQALNIQQKGKKSGILELSMISTDQNEVATVLNTITNVYVEKNVSRSSAEAKLSLEFLEKQLPPLRVKLDAAEKAYNSYRIKHGTIDLQEETRSVLLNINSMTASLLELEQNRNELRKKYKAEHPVIRALDGKITILKQEEDRLEAKSNELPEVEQEIIRLAREVEITTLLYSKLLNTTQELRVAKAASVGNVRIIDQAFRPLDPIKPNKKIILTLAGILASFSAVVVAFLRNALFGGIDHSCQIEQKLGVMVYASIAHSMEQKETSKQFEDKDIHSAGILVEQQPDIVTVENLRTLRTNLYQSLVKSRNNIILISGPCPKVGNTFISVNIGALLAEAGKEVLVIDGDLRRGVLHSYGGMSRDIGLSDLIMDTSIHPLSCIQSTSVPGLSMITSGELPNNPAELLMRPCFEQLLKQLSDIYDYVIIDGPPILSVTDSAIIGRYAGITLMTVRAHYHSMQELEQAQQQLHKSGVIVNGVIFNDLMRINSPRLYGKESKKIAFNLHDQVISRVKELLDKWNK